MRKEVAEAKNDEAAAVTREELETSVAEMLALNGLLQMRINKGKEEAHKIGTCVYHFL